MQKHACRSISELDAFNNTDVKKKETKEIYCEGSSLNVD
jgi:hypothetical protein